MRTAAEHWDEFERMVMRHDAPPIQRLDMKRSFYAGMMSAFNELSIISDKDEDVAEALAEDFYKEITNTLRGMGRGVN